MLIVAVIFGLSVRSIVTTRQFLAVAVAADGVVVDLSESVDEDGSTYFPVVRFVAPDGQVVRFKSGIGSNPPDYRVGDPVRVLYDPSNPRTARLDTWGNRWGGALAGMIVGGVLLLLLAAVLVFGRVSQRTQGQKASVRKRRDPPRPGPPPSGTQPNHALRQEPPKGWPQDSMNEDRPQDTTNKDRPQDSKNDDG
jgi:hypothetical protein